MLDLSPSKEKTLERALRWDTKIYTSGWSVEDSIALVADGKKPFTSQCPRPGLRGLARKYNIKIRPIRRNGLLIDYFMYLPNNIDIVNLATDNIQAKFSRDVATYYFIFGVTLGYPLKDVLSFCINHCIDCPSLIEINQICKNYVPLTASICEVPLPARTNQL